MAVAPTNLTLEVTADGFTRHEFKLLARATAHAGSRSRWCKPAVSAGAGRPAW